MTTRYLIVEDEIMFAHMLAGMLRGIPGLTDVEIAHNREEGFRLVEDYAPDLLILDLALPDGSGVDVARRAARLNPESRSIILSAEAATFIVPHGLRRHICGVVEKAKAYSVLQREVLQFLASRPDAGDHADPENSLSPREREVFRELGHGLINKEIARRLGISTATVGLHRKRIAAKLKVRGPALVRLASLHYRADGA
jgi:DNA-binding NarL/FixJ family response regulator